MKPERVREKEKERVRERKRESEREIERKRETMCVEVIFCVSYESGIFFARVI